MPKNTKTKKTTAIKLDPNNFREHSEENKAVIRKSLEELGAGRSVVTDADDVLIAGNGVFEQAQELGLPYRVIETEGEELIVVKRKDLKRGMKKRDQLALADNSTTDLSQWNWGNIHSSNWKEAELKEWGVDYWVDDQEYDMDHFFSEKPEVDKEKFGIIVLQYTPNKHQAVLEALEKLEGTKEDIIYNLLCNDNSEKAS
jgi:hypothetical protein